MYRNIYTTPFHPLPNELYWSENNGPQVYPD